MPLQGDLGSIPLADVIQLVSQARRSGTLYVASTEDARVLQFRLGEIVSATSLEQRFRLGHALCQRGFLDPIELDEALAEQRMQAGRSLGDVLLRRGSITKEGLHTTLHDQAQDAIDDALHWQDGGFLFADASTEEQSASAPGGISFNVQPLLFEGLRKLDEWARVKSVLDDPAAVPDFAESAGQPELPPGSGDALELLELVDGRRTIGAIVRKSPWTEHRVLRAFGALLEAGLIRIRIPTESSKMTPMLWQDHGRRVPVAPRAGARAVALATLEHAGALELHAAALADPGLAVAVLRAATSIGKQEGATHATLRDAILALGEEVARRVLVAAGLRGCYCGVPGPPPEIWRHSLVTAVASARLVSALGKPAERAAEAYLCGLLHDIGAMILRLTTGEGYERVDALVEKGMPLPDAERKVLGTGHDKVGSSALTQCGASPQLIEATLSHHMAPRAEPWQLGVLLVADQLAAAVGFDAESIGGQGQPVEVLADRVLGMNPKQFAKVAVALEEEVGVREPLW